MHTTNLTNQVTRKTEETINVSERKIPDPDSKPMYTSIPRECMQETSGDTVLKVPKDAHASHITDIIPVRLEMDAAFEDLICAPIIAASKAQRELSDIYMEQLMHLGYTPIQNIDDLNIDNFKMNRPDFRINGTTKDVNTDIEVPKIPKDNIPSDADTPDGYKSDSGIRATISRNPSAE